MGILPKDQKKIEAIKTELKPQCIKKSTFFLMVLYMNKLFVKYEICYNQVVVRIKHAIPG
jgi:hypothetical protein